ncbi:MAG: hypothetical protein WCT77_00840 [Bacteroidota bacterium]
MKSNLNVVKLSKKQKREYATAIHEIGHCIAYDEFNQEFEYVTIVENDEALGHVHSNMSKVIRIFTLKDKVIDLNYFNLNVCSDQKIIESDIIISMSGYIAQGIYEKKKISQKYSDFKSELYNLNLFFEDGIILQNYFSLMLSIADSLIKYRWKMLLHLANVLYERKTLTFDEYWEEKSKYLSNSQEMWYPERKLS